MSKLLPQEYQRIEYLQSSGTQYLRIITGAVDNTYGLKMEYSMNEISDNYPAGFSTTNNKRFLFWGTYNGAWRYGWYNQSTAITAPNYSFSNYPTGIANFYTASLNYLNSGKCRFADNPESNISGYGTAFTNTDFLLFRSYSTTCVTARIKWAKLTRGTEIVRDLIPCRRTSDNVLGMYDLIGDEFYTNAGSGTFIAGPSATLPKGYQQLDKVIFQSAAYINTGVVGNDTDAFEMDYDIKAISTKVRSLQGFGPSGCEYWGWKADDKYECGNGATSISIGNRDHIVWKYQKSSTAGSEQLIINNIIAYTRAAGTTITNKSLMINSLNGSYTGKFEAYSIKVKQNGELIRKFVPCIRLSDNKVGMYDLITDTFYGSNGSAQILAGDKKPTNILCINKKIVSNVRANNVDKLVKSINGIEIMPGK